MCGESLSYAMSDLVVKIVLRFHSPPMQHHSTTPMCVRDNNENQTARVLQQSRGSRPFTFSYRSSPACACQVATLQDFKLLKVQSVI